MQHIFLITVNKQNFTVGQVAVSDLGLPGEVHLYTDDDVILALYRVVQFPSLCVTA